MWICDANRRCLKWFDQEGNFKSTIDFSDSFAYASSFDVCTSDREMLVCDRRDSIVKLYDLTSREPYRRIGIDRP
ncbi:hypothetical protein AAVH_35853 [Aphelenchoides avenae]|nr:hypothetical protein AAVH_35853 [Aphelenchus avenae]